MTAPDPRGGSAGWVAPRVVRYACPGFRCDVVPYTFYRHAPAGYVLDVVHIAMESYAPLSGRAFAEQVMPQLADDGAADVVVLGGSAFSLANSYERLRQELAEISADAGVRVVTNLLAVMDELRGDGVEAVVACHRLAGVDDDVLTSFLASAGLECRQVVSAPTSLETNMTTTLDAGARAAAELVERSVQVARDGEAILLLGGSWLVDAAALAAEQAGVGLYNNVVAIPRMLHRGMEAKGS